MVGATTVMEEEVWEEVLEEVWEEDMAIGPMVEWEGLTVEVEAMARWTLHFFNRLRCGCTTCSIIICSCFYRRALALPFNRWSQWLGLFHR